MFKKLNPVLLLFAMLLLVSCGESKSGEASNGSGDYSKKENSAETESTDPLQNKGIGPVKSVTLGDIDEAQVARGKEIFANMCTACHKWDKKFVGPALDGITERRSPEWIMNMILNPEEMIAKDPIAKKLLIENNMAVMANQNLTEEEARDILEYFRGLQQKVSTN